MFVYVSHFFLPIFPLMSSWLIMRLTLDHPIRVMAKWEFEVNHSESKSSLDSESQLTDNRCQTGLHSHACAYALLPHWHLRFVPASFLSTPSCICEGAQDRISLKMFPYACGVTGYSRQISHYRNEGEFNSVFE